jgi:hypothetical protein
MPILSDLQKIYGFTTHTYTKKFIQLLTMGQSRISFGISKTTTTVLDIINELFKIASTNIPPDTRTDAISVGSTYTISLPGLTEKIEMFGSGTSAAVFRGITTGYIYKRVHFDMTIEYEDLPYNLEKLAREICVGVFIQTVLNNDRKYGSKGLKSDDLTLES